MFGAFGGSTGCPKCQEEPDEQGQCPKGHGDVAELTQRAMDQMMSAMRGGQIPTLNPEAEKGESAFLDEETLDKREHGVEMLMEVAKMRAAQHNKMAFEKLLRGESYAPDLDTVVSAFGDRAIETGKEYCRYCHAAIWHDEDDSVWRHEDGERTDCGVLAPGFSAEPEPDLNADDLREV